MPVVALPAVLPLLAPMVLTMVLLLTVLLAVAAVLPRPALAAWPTVPMAAAGLLLQLRLGGVGGPEGTSCSAAAAGAAAVAVCWPAAGHAACVP